MHQIEDLIEVKTMINGVMVHRQVPSRMHLGDFLRVEMGLNGLHLGCEHGVCGACTILVDGLLVRSCLMLAAQIDGCKVQTIEGVVESGEAQMMVSAFQNKNAAQCGFCTSGILIACFSMISNNNKLKESEIKEKLKDNLCRCGVHHKIIKSVLKVMN